MHGSKLLHVRVHSSIYLRPMLSFSFKEDLICLFDLVAKHGEGGCLNGDSGGELCCSAVAGSLFPSIMLGPGSGVRWVLFLLTDSVDVSIR